MRNDSGQILGCSGTYEGVCRAVLWERGTIRRLGDLVMNQYALPYGINNRGQIVFESAGHAVLWENGSVTNLGLVPGAEGMSTAFAINDAGQVVGWSTQPGGHAVVWTR